MAPKPCIKTNFLFIPDCLTVGDTVYDNTGGVVGKLADATVHANGTLDFSPSSVEKRSTELVKRHDYAVVCRDSAFTQYCRSSPWGYSCDQNGKLLFTGSREASCDQSCGCVNVAPVIVPVPCIRKQFLFISDCHLVNDTVFAENGTVVVGTLDFNPSPLIETRSLDLVKRHDYAVNCDNDRILTTFCIGAPYKYSCDKRGQITCDGQGFRVCLDFCTCQDLSPKPKCIVAPLIVDCNVVDGTIYDNNGTVLSQVSDAIVHANGDIELQSPAAIEKRDTDVTTSNYVLSCESTSGTKLCSGSPSFYSCNSNGKVVMQGPSNEVCDIECHCFKGNGGGNPKTPLLPPIGKPTPAPLSTIPITTITIVPLPSTTKPLVPRTLETWVTIQDIAFGCESVDGDLKPALSYDNDLTESCKASGYSCVPDMSSGAIIWDMVKPSPPIASCVRDANEEAEAMKKTKVSVTTKVTATATTTESNTLDFSTSTKKVAARDADEVKEAMKTKVSVTTKVTASATSTESNTLDFSTPTPLP
ncbi:hypothetical protein H2200_001674 [Cladophialophora chaetospira]|uniref:Uncharacterized protein n=1 Tax=Cladophialophora chaetospira TaxID=386627 RepID=A0AA38XLB6_9EURO|nr:hypothetical protein H2200_001674 [Cladophialophora chaetospira]